MAFAAFPFAFHRVLPPTKRSHLPSFEVRSSPSNQLIYFLKEKCWNWNTNFLGSLCAYNLVPEWVLDLCIDGQEPQPKGMRLESFTLSLPKGEILLAILTSLSTSSTTFFESRHPGIRS